MKDKISLFILILLLTLISSGCSERTFEFNFNSNSKFIGNKISDSINDSLKASSGEVIKEVEKIKENSIQNLLDKKGCFKCVWRIEKEEVFEDAEVDNEDEEITGGVEEGLIYVKANNFLKEVVIKENNRENKVSVLYVEGDFFQWSSLISQGNKMSLRQAVDNEIIDLNKGYQWHCEEIDFENEVFDIPSNIEFVNFSQYAEKDKNL